VNQDGMRPKCRGIPIVPELIIIELLSMQVCKPLIKIEGTVDDRPLGGSPGEPPPKKK